jgi:ribosomal protein S18 acetylase RimI-like enzyme
MVKVKETEIETILSVHEQIPEFAETLPDKAHFENRYMGKNPLLICAYMEKSPIGYMIAYDKFADGSYYIWMAGVIPQYRNRGALTALMDYLFAWAKAQKYKTVKIKTRNDKRDMLKFLVTAGFDFTTVQQRENIKDNRIELEKSIGAPVSVIVEPK